MWSGGKKGDRPNLIDSGAFSLTFCSGALYVRGRVDAREGGGGQGWLRLC